MRSSDWVVNIDLAQDAIIENSSFWGHRGRAIVNKSRNTTIRNNKIGSESYGHSSWHGVFEGFCPGSLNYNEGPFIAQSRDNHKVYRNSGIYGNEIAGCQQSILLK